MDSITSKTGLYGVVPMLGMSNATGCSAPSNTTIEDIKKKLATATANYTKYRNLYLLVNSYVGKVGGCGYGRNVSHWWDKYKAFRPIVDLGKTSLCEPNFIEYTYKKYKTLQDMFASEVSTLNAQLKSAESTYNTALNNYEDCLQKEADAIATVNLTDPTVIAAQTEATTTLAKIEAERKAQELAATLEIESQQEEGKERKTIIIAGTLILVLMILGTTFVFSK